MQYNTVVQRYTNCGIEELVNVGVAERLDEHDWIDHKGNSWYEEEAHGCKVCHWIVRPDLWFCSDGMGGNVSMKYD